MDKIENGRLIQGFEVIRADGNPYTYVIGTGLDWPITKKITKIFMSKSYHGDHEQLWIVVESEGVEVDRFNLRSPNLICFRWMDPA